MLFLLGGHHMGVSENVVYPIVPNGFADHYPYEKWLFHWGYTLFSDKPICSALFSYTWDLMFFKMGTSNAPDPDLIHWIGYLS